MAEEYPAPSRDNPSSEKTERPAVEVNDARGQVPANEPPPNEPVNPTGGPAETSEDDVSEDEANEPDE